MMRKVLFLMCSSAVVSAGIIGTDYSPATSVSYSSISTPTVVKTVATPILEKSLAHPLGYTKILQSAPVYESILTTKESKFEGPDGTQHSTFSKSFDTAYSSVKKFESTSSKDGDILANTVPGIYSTSVHSPVFYHPQTSYTYSSPLVHSINIPNYSKSVTHTTHNFPLSKTVVSPTLTSYTTPILSKTKVVSSDLSSYSTPLIHTINSPISYTTHDVPLTKTIISPAVTSYTTPVLSKTKVVASDLSSYSSPLIHTVSSPVSIAHSTPTVVSPTITSYTTPVVSNTKVVTSGLSSYSSHTPVIEAQPIKTTLTYSAAPVVSHMSFNGLGASYAW